MTETQLEKGQRGKEMSWSGSRGSLSVRRGLTKFWGNEQTKKDSGHKWHQLTGQQPHLQGPGSAVHQAPAVHCTCVRSPITPAWQHPGRNIDHTPDILQGMRARPWTFKKLPALTAETYTKNPV